MVLSQNQGTLHVFGSFWFPRKSIPTRDQNHCETHPDVPCLRCSTPFFVFSLFFKWCLPPLGSQTTEAKDLKKHQVALPQCPLFFCWVPNSHLVQPGRIIPKSAHMPLLGVQGTIAMTRKAELGGHFSRIDSFATPAAEFFFWLTAAN